MGKAKVIYTHFCASATKLVEPRRGRGSPRLLSLVLVALVQTLKRCKQADASDLCVSVTGGLCLIVDGCLVSVSSSHVTVHVPKTNC